VTLASLPLTANGKLDRKALPAPEQDSYLHQRYEAPRTPLEKALAEIWSSILSVENPGIHDDFFELGGHSLTAVQLTVHIASLISVRLPLSDIFRYPTIVGLAGRILDEIADDEVEDG
jgi:acyl carrier protein